MGPTYFALLVLPMWDPLGSRGQIHCGPASFAHMGPKRPRAHIGPMAEQLPSPPLTICSGLQGVLLEKHTFEAMNSF